MQLITSSMLSFSFLYGLSWAVAVPEALIRSTCDTTGIEAERASQVELAFSSAGIIPLIAPSIKPTTDLEAVYSDGKAVDLGTVFSVAETIPAPIVTFTPEEGYDPATTNYTFIIVDPDAPSPDAPLLRYFLHALYYNVHPSCVSGPVLSQQVALAPYLSPTPLSVQFHRYIFLVYRQPAGEFEPQLQVGEAARGVFDLGGFVSAGKLELVGGNYFNEGLNSTVQ